MPATKIHEVARVGTDTATSLADSAASLGVDLAGLEGAITDICGLVDRLRVQRAELLHALRLVDDYFRDSRMRAEEYDAMLDLVRRTIAKVEG